MNVFLDYSCSVCVCCELVVNITNICPVRTNPVIILHCEAQTNIPFNLSCIMDSECVILTTLFANVICIEHV